MAAVALPASAQVVIGGSGQPNVEVNWGVLEGLGRQPTLADMLKNEVPASPARAALNQPSAPKTVQYRPYKAGADTPAQPKKVAAVAKPKPMAATPVSAKTVAPVASPAVAQLVQAAQKPAPVAELPKPVAQPALPPKPVVEPVKAVAAAPAGPQISLPEVPKPVAAPVQIAKVEPPAAPPAVAPPAPPVAKAEPVAVAAPMALTPTPPAPVPAPIAKVEPAPVPQQLASVAPAAPAPAPAPAPAISKGGDTLTVAFASESARLSDAVHPELDKLVKRLQKDDGLGLQLLAYAEGDDASASKARRMSLSRALEVRKYLMEQGVRSTRIEVRALGNKIEGPGPADRVDALVVNR